MSFLSGRDALPADEYPYTAKLATYGVKVQRKSRQKIYEEQLLEILKDLPKTEDLPFATDYTQHEWLYRTYAEKRDKANGIIVEGPEHWEQWLTLQDPGGELALLLRDPEAAGSGEEEKDDMQM